MHGAKGLQAPLVVLPDTASLPPDEAAFAWRRDPATGAEVPLWAPRAEFACPVVLAERAAAAERGRREHNRLLYVALTRAEDRLVVCGWRTRQALPETCWYELVRRGFEALGAEDVPFEASPGPWMGSRLVHAAPQTEPVQPARVRPQSEAPPLPPWAGRPGHWRPTPPPSEPALPRPLAPSRPEGALFGPVPRAASPLGQRGGTATALRRGTLVHGLLQHLPALPAAERGAAALAYLGRPGAGLTQAEARRLARQVLAVLDSADLAPLFAPGSRAEQPLTGLVGGAVITGVVDRMAVRPDGVWLADFKTGRDAPADPADTPVPYLRQLAAYRAVLEGIYPDRPVHAALVWTRSAQAVPIPGALLDPYAPGA